MRFGFSGTAAETRAVCVLLLALLPGQTAPDWRLAVYSSALQSESDLERLSAVKGVPLLLHQLGSKSYSALYSTLVYVLVPCLL